jgi:hypothetical protein
MATKTITLEDKIKNTRESLELYYEEIESYKRQIEELEGKIYNTENYYIRWNKESLEKLLEEQNQLNQSNK